MDKIDINSIDAAKIQVYGVAGYGGYFVGPRAHEAAAFVYDQTKKWKDVIESKDAKVLTKYDLIIGLIVTAKLIFDVQRTI